MRDNIIHTICNFILRFASKEYQNNLDRVYRLGMIVDRELTNENVKVWERNDD